jgi:hypothetical protein
VAVSEAERELMLQGLLGLRRVRELLPGNTDVVRGIEGIEAALGETVSQRTAARALGVRHPELSKLLTGGRLKTEDTSRGKAQVRVDSLLELIEERGEVVREQPAWKQRRADREAEPVPEGRDIAAIMRMRALAYHRALARNLDRAMVERAQTIVGEWRESGRLSAEQADNWDQLLERPVSDVAARITDYSPAGDALRERSPFEMMGRRGDDPR